MSAVIPLLSHRDLEAPIAWQAGLPVSAGQFLRDVAALAARLPSEREVVNLCADRYRFLVGFAAALVRGQVSLLPPSGSGGAIAELVVEHRRAYCLTDGARAPAGVDELMWQGAAPDDPLPQRIPELRADAVAAVAFTSGSTGTPQPHAKRWGSMVEGTLVAGRRLGLDRVQAVLATVPAQHMYGLESSVLLPLVWGRALVAERPFFPGDVAAALAALPPGVGLVSTPVHLRALVEAEVDLPGLAFLLSATAPLSKELAGRAEGRYGAPLYEIYGTTETGQLATRRPTLDGRWQLFDGITLRPDGEEGAIAAGGNLAAPTPLPDRLRLCGDDRFELLGRSADLLNIAGKRMALGDLTARLLALPGVQDAAVLAPDDRADRVERLAALVVAPGCSAQTLLAALREQLDPVFLPRPLKLVESLPRSATGKLPRAELLRLLAEGETA